MTINNPSSIIINFDEFNHVHNIDDIPNLPYILDNKADKIHGHLISDIGNLQASLDSLQNSINAINQLQTQLNNALDGKISKPSNWLNIQISNNWTAAGADFYPNRCRKIESFLEINIAIVRASGSYTTNEVVATLPISVAPSKSFRCFAPNTVGGNSAILTFNSNGEVQLGNNATSFVINTVFSI